MTAIAAPFNDRLTVDVPAGATARDVFELVRGKLRSIGLDAMAGFSNVVEGKILDHITGKTAYTQPSQLHIALCTVAVGETDTGSTITEATYTGYGRKAVATADVTAASTTGETHNSVAQAFAACTAGSSVVVSFAACSASTGGDVVMFGSTASTTINTSNQPANVPISGLSLNLD